MSRKKREKQHHFFDHLAKNGDNQTIPGEEHTQHLKRAACNGVQTHFQKPSAHQVTFSWQDVDTLFSSAATGRNLTTG